MWSLRRKVSLLRANGHQDASNYPIGHLEDEAVIVVERINQQLATVGVIVQSATLTTGMGASKEAAKQFANIIKTLSGD